MSTGNQLLFLYLGISCVFPLVSLVFLVLCVCPQFVPLVCCVCISGLGVADPPFCLPAKPPPHLPLIIPDLSPQPLQHKRPGLASTHYQFVAYSPRVTPRPAPLTRLTSVKTPFSWPPEAEKAFQQLKSLFTSASVLIKVDTSKQFIVEVDASDTGVGAVLSQASGPGNKLHLCVLFSHCLSPAEQNYDVGNRELLALSLALNEWRHWLEGAEQPFRNLD